MIKNDKRTPVVASLRYHDVFVKEHGKWPFDQRTLLVDWTDRSSKP
jgi:hypothetical protein